MADRLQAGLVGGGPWARRVYAPTLAGHPGYELVGVWTRRPEAAAEIAEANGAEPYAALGDLIDAVDVVAISVPPAVQPDIAISAARAGKHLILEKPVAENRRAAEQLAGEIAAAGVANVIFLTSRFAAETREWLADIAADGPWAGGNARWLSGALLGGDFAGSAWRQQHGALLDIGPHLFDLLDAALGPIVDVPAASFREPDLWHVICRHDGGATSAATLSMALAIDPSVVDFEVYGSAGRRALAARRAPAEECLAMLLDELAAMVRSGATTHPCDIHRGVHLQGVIDEVRASARR
jgi:predicted dehydrogenase